MYEQGINFRATEAYRQDIPPDTFEIGDTANYPRITPQGNTVGWEVGPTGGTRNRTTTPIAKLGGIHFATNAVGGESTYRLDLPKAGWYEIRIAMGDSGYSSIANASVYDGDSLIHTVIENETTGSGWYADAKGIIWTWREWPTQNTPIYVYVSSGILRLKIGGGGASNNSCVAHFYAKYVSDTAINSPDGWKPAISRYIN